MCSMALGLSCEVYHDCELKLNDLVRTANHAILCNNNPLSIVLYKSQVGSVSSEHAQMCLSRNLQQGLGNYLRRQAYLDTSSHLYSSIALS